MGSCLLSLCYKPFQSLDVSHATHFQINKQSASQWPCDAKKRRVPPLLSSTHLRFSPEDMHIVMADAQTLGSNNYSLTNPANRADVRSDAPPRRPSNTAATRFSARIGLALPAPHANLPLALYPERRRPPVSSRQSRDDGDPPLKRLKNQHGRCAPRQRPPRNRSEPTAV